MELLLVTWVFGSTYHNNNFPGRIQTTPTAAVPAVKKSGILIIFSLRKTSYPVLFVRRQAIILKITLRTSRQTKMKRQHNE